MGRLYLKKSHPRRLLLALISLPFLEVQLTCVSLQTKALLAVLFGGRKCSGFPLLRISVAEIGHSILDIFAIMFTFVGKWVCQGVTVPTARHAICPYSDSHNLKSA